MDEPIMMAEYRWIESGQGPAVVLLHGLFGASADWEAVMAGLGPHHRTLALTLPIFETPADDLSVASLRAHVEAFLDAQRLGPVVLAGNSLGGHVALDLALHAPARVRGLVLAGSSWLPEPPVPGSLVPRQSPDSTRRTTRARRDDLPERMGRRGYALRALQLRRSVPECDLEARLPEIVCPTLLVWGVDDPITPPEIAYRFQCGLARAELILIPGCGHAPMLEQPEAFLEAMGPFLQRLTAATPAHCARALLRKTPAP